VTPSLQGRHQNSTEDHNYLTELTDEVERLRKQVQAQAKEAATASAAQAELQAELSSERAETERLGVALRVEVKDKIALETEKNALEPPPERYLELKRINEELMEHLKSVREELREKGNGLASLHEEHDALAGTSGYYKRRVGEQREDLVKMRRVNETLSAQAAYDKIEIEKYKKLLSGVSERNQTLTVENSRISRELLDKSIS